MRYVCPQNRRTVDCRGCGKTVVHVREEWVTSGGPLPKCETHGLELVPA